MSQPLPFSEAHRDCLQELCNVSMGVAGEALAKASRVFVKLSIPKIRYLEPAEIIEALQLVNEGEKISATSQTFTTGNYHGRALVVMTESSFADLLSRTEEDPGKQNSKKEDKIAAQLLCDMSETICQSCLYHLARQLDKPLSLQPPEILALHVALEDLQISGITAWQQIISIEINYHLENHPFNCDLLLLFPDQVIDELVAELDDFIY